MRIWRCSLLNFVGFLLTLEGDYVCNIWLAVRVLNVLKFLLVLSDSAGVVKKLSWIQFLFTIVLKFCSCSEFLLCWHNGIRLYVLLYLSQWTELQETKIEFQMNMLSISVL